MAKSVCSACKETFSSVSSFDSHRVGKYEPMTRRCLTRDEMLAKNMVLNERGMWTTGAFTGFGEIFHKDGAKTGSDVDKAAS